MRLLFQSTLPTRGSDVPTWIRGLSSLGISIHAPHEGERLLCHYQHQLEQIFQSTLPTRGSDLLIDAASGSGLTDFNPRSPRGGATSKFFTVDFMHRNFNPRSPRGGATQGIEWISAMSENFNPRSPRGGATYFQLLLHTQCSISIHAPHEGERRSNVDSRFEFSWYFNPRSPRGGATPAFL